MISVYFEFRLQGQKNTVDFERGRRNLACESQYLSSASLAEVLPGDLNTAFTSVSDTAELPWCFRVCLILLRARRQASR